MNDVPSRFGQNNGGNDSSSPDHAPDEWAAVLARTVAHLAAQLTMTQIRLRALASLLQRLESRPDLIRRLLFQKL